MRTTYSTLAILTFVICPSGHSISVEKDLSLTFSEKQALDKFRERVAPLLKHDYMKLDIYLVRWLRAQDFNLDAAEAMLKKTLNWRKEQNMDNILKENFDDMFIDYPSRMDTYDKEGRPINVFDMSDMNFRRAVIQGRGPRLVRFVMHNLENLTQQVFERQGRGMNVTQWKLLVNAEDFNVVNHLCPSCIPYWLQVVEIIDHHYHGWLDEFIVVQATPAVHTLTEFFRPLLSRQFRETLRIFGSNRAQWMKYLDERISKSERYPSYGGTKILDT